jgi:hypothetical protein
MFRINLSMFKQQQPIEIDIIEEGSEVVHEDGRVGIVKKIAVSPYWIEEVQEVLRAYVLFDGSADWCLASELGLAKASLVAVAS